MSDELTSLSPSEAINAIIDRVTSEISQSVYGHEQTARLLVGAFLIGGHVLLEGPPGIAKTLLAKSFANSLGLLFNRIQFTPDLMPSDVTGVYVFDQKSSAFRFSKGPIFADIVLADEINRTPPKTQSALLEAMEERFVTIDGRRHPLSDMFFVIATQNPIEHEGTFPLPEAQLDRFLFKLVMSYPGKEYEQQMIEALSSKWPLITSAEQNPLSEGSTAKAVASRTDLQTARALLRKITLDSTVADYIQRLVEATRSHSDLALGASPRAALNLALAAKLNAALDGRDYVIPDDVKAMTPYVLAHRLVFVPEIYDTTEAAPKVIAEILTRVAVGEGSQAGWSNVLNDLDSSTRS